MENNFKIILHVWDGTKYVEELGKISGLGRLNIPKTYLIESISVYQTLREVHVYICKRDA